MPVEFAAPADELLSQGDLFANVPSLTVHDLQYMVKVNQNEYRLEGEPGQRREDRPYPANAQETRTFGVVLTHDCEVDKQTRKALIHIALVRPLSETGVQAHLHQEFRENTRHRVFYLPSNEYLDGENYVDLRRVTAIRADTLLTLPRLASMNEDGRRMLREQIFRFYTRRYLPDEWVDWPEEEQ